MNKLAAIQNLREEVDRPLSEYMKTNKPLPETPLVGGRHITERFLIIRSDAACSTGEAGFLRDGLTGHAYPCFRSSCTHLSEQHTTISRCVSPFVNPIHAPVRSISGASGCGDVTDSTSTLAPQHSHARGRDSMVLMGHLYLKSKGSSRQSTDDVFDVGLDDQQKPSHVYLTTVALGTRAPMPIGS